VTSTRHHQRLRGVADPETAADEPAACSPALPASVSALETLREATPRPPAASRREVHRTTRPNRPPEEVLPVHDDCTRLRVLRAYPRCGQKTAIQFIDHVLAKLPFAVERVQTDNGSEFGASFHWHLLDKGIDHVKIRPRTPRLNGKVERSHRIDSEEFYRLLEGQVIDDANLFSDKLQEWEDYYNYHRPHGALSGQTPYERLRQKAQDPLS